MEVFLLVERRLLSRDALNVAFSSRVFLNNGGMHYCTLGIGLFSQLSFTEERFGQYFWYIGLIVEDYMITGFNIRPIISFVDVLY